MLDHKLIIQEIFPELEINSLSILHQGINGDAVEVNGNFVFCFPKIEIQNILGISSLLDRIRPMLTIRIPKYEYMSPRCFGYRKLPGTRLDRMWYDDFVVRQIIHFLAQLHSIGPDAADLPVPDIQEVKGHYRQLIGDNIPALRAIVGESYAAVLMRLATEFVDGLEYEPCLVHGDLNDSNLLVEDSRLSGVIDWNQARIGDPATDVAHVLRRFPGLRIHLTQTIVDRAMRYWIFLVCSDLLTQGKPAHEIQCLFQELKDVLRIL